MSLQEKAVIFFEKVGTPKTLFCQRIGISPKALYDWLNGKKCIGQATINKIDKYLSDYDSIILGK